MSRFVGRHLELERLQQTARRKLASFIVVKGRRRIGKSRLIEEFAKNFDNYYVFSGLPPEPGTTGKDQLTEFSRQLARQFRTAHAQYADWGDALWAVAERVRSGKALLFFDEISWLGSKDPAFLGHIKNAWDQHFRKNDRLVFVVCGSASSWIEENILSGTGFVGRISFTLTLDELPLEDCSYFWPAGVSAYEKFKLLGVTGGVPKYLEEIDPRRSAEENIKRLCFTRGGLLVNEFEHIFANVFLRDSDYYRRILEQLSAGPQELAQLQKKLVGAQHGRFSEYLSELELAGFVARDYTWDLKSGLDGRLSQFRLKDNYLRFYLKYIARQRSKIERDSFTFKSLTSLPEWATVMALQFENLVLNNRRHLHRLLDLDADEIVNENPFRQRPTIRQAGCQIDYMVQTKFGTLYVCEIKFSKNPIGVAVVTEVEAKIKALRRPRGTSYRPVLIHVNGVTDEVIDSDYFAHIIDMSEMLQPRIMPTPAAPVPRDH